MTRAIGVGVIGMGWMGTVHSRSYQAVTDRFYDQGLEAELVICADDLDERARKAQTIFKFEQCTTNWREVVENPRVEVVNIAAPNYLHLEMVQAAANAGKHIFCEKPVGRTPEETAAIAQTAHDVGVLSFVGFNYRWAPLVQYTHQLIQEGKLGEITHYRGRFFAMYASNPLSQLSWRFQHDKSGYGVLGDIMSHVADMALMLVGPIERVISHQHTFIDKRPKPVPGRGTHFTVGLPDDPKGEVTNEDYVGTLVEFENGAQGSLEVCRTIYGPKCEMAFEINGTKGALKWNFERMNEMELYLPDETGGHEGFVRIVAGPDHPFHGRFNPGPGVGMSYDDLKAIEAYNFLQSVADGQQRPPGFTEALALAEVQAAMIRSWKSKTWERVGPII
jgi:predicted dehydrogenase